MDPRDDPKDPNRLGVDGSPAGPSRPQKTPQPRKASGAGTDSLLAEMVAEFAQKPKSAQSPLNTAEKFDMALVSNDPTMDSRRFDERDFQSHRKENFPNTHMPLRPILSRSLKKKPSSAGGRDGSERPAHGKRTLEDDGGTMMEKMPLIIPTPKLPKIAARLDGPSVPVGVQTDDGDLFESPLKKVQFQVGGTAFNIGHRREEEAEIKIYRPRMPKYEDPQKRLRPGSEVRDGSNLPLMVQGMNLSDVDSVDELDEEELTSHRYADTKAYRRHHFSPRQEAEDAALALAINHSRFDHRPHEVFVELDILSGQGEDREWKEAARWIKYEEDVEEGADRWGRPHVASLSFHSLINLTGLLESGVVLLDLEERDLPGVAYRVVEQMGRDDLILAEEKATVMRSLLLKHKHVNEHGKGWNFGLKRNPGSSSSLQNMSEDRSRTAAAGTSPHLLQRRSSSGTRLIQQSSVPAHMSSSHESPRQVSNTGSSSHVSVDLRTGLSDLKKISPVYLSAENLKWIANKETPLMRQIPGDAEASIVLVGKDETLQGPTIAFVRLAESAYMPNITEVPIPVRFIFVLLGPSSIDLDYKEIGRSISTLMSNRHFHNIAYEAFDRKQLLQGIHEFLDESMVVPPGDWDRDLFPFAEIQEKSKAILRKKKRLDVPGEGGDAGDGPPSKDDHGDELNPFKRTKRVFGGLINDIKRRYPKYWSDIKDGFNVQCLATVIFIYFACVAGAIAFGGLMSKKTHDYIGITEVLLGTSVGGLAFALFSGQPLLIVGSTGPTLVFDDSLFKFCLGNGMTGPQILSIRVWIGIWTAVIGLVVVCCEGSVVVRFFTRFTQEIFALLISLVFIVESMNNLVQIYKDHPLIPVYSCIHETKKPRPNVALLSTILMFGTFAIAYCLREFKNSTYLNATARKIIGNFAVLIAIIVMVVVDELIVHPATTKLDIPDALEHGLANTKPTDRSWFIHPVALPLYWIGASIVPAFLLYIVIFLECSISELLIGKKEMHLKKGSGFHLDVLILCFVNTGMGFLGSCWISAAMVRGVAHASALTVYSTNNPPGEKPKVLGVKEQRLTGFAVSIIMGFSVLMSAVLKLIPIAVLFGVFLYMGVSSTAGVQMLERIMLYFKQVKNHPQVPYVRRVRTWKMNIYTLIQIICLGALWGVKSSPGALALPLVIILLVPFRQFILPCWFKPAELAALDGNGEEKPEPQLAIQIKEPVVVHIGTKDKHDHNGTNGVKETTASGKINVVPVTTENGQKQNFRSI